MKNAFDRDVDFAAAAFASIQYELLESVSIAWDADTRSLTVREVL